VHRALVDANLAGFFQCLGYAADVLLEVNVLPHILDPIPNLSLLFLILRLVKSAAGLGLENGDTAAALKSYRRTNAPELQFERSVVECRRGPDIGIRRLGALESSRYFRRQSEFLGGFIEASWFCGLCQPLRFRLHFFGSLALDIVLFHLGACFRKFRW